MTGRRYPDLEVLVGAARGTTLPHEADEARLRDLYAYPARAATGTAVVRANMVATVDGAAWGPDGRSGTINGSGTTDDSGSTAGGGTDEGSADHRVFRVLRALADVVLVGAGTARTEGYVPLSVAPELLPGRVAAGLAGRLEVAVVTRSGALPPGLAGAIGDRAPFVLTSARGAAALPRHLPAERVLVLGADEVDVVAGVGALADLGLPRVLCEGGPSLLGTLLAAGAVDELCQTTTPLLTGGTAARTVITEEPLAGAPAHLDLLLHHRGALLSRWALRPEPRGPRADSVAV